MPLLIDLAFWAIFVKFGKGHKRIDETGSNRLKLGTLQYYPPHGAGFFRLHNLPHFTISNSEVVLVEQLKLFDRPVMTRGGRGGRYKGGWVQGEILKMSPIHENFRAKKSFVTLPLKLLLFAYVAFVLLGMSLFALGLEMATFLCTGNSRV